MLDGASFSLIKRILLVMAGTEQNPGPEFENVLTTQRAGQVCPVCNVGKIVFESKHQISVYGRNGPRTHP